MKVFKVRFDNNTAVAAEFEGYIYTSECEVARKDGKRLIKSLNVVADSPEESITIANDVVTQYMGFMSAPR